MASDLSSAASPLGPSPAPQEQLAADWQSAGFWRQGRRFARHRGALLGLAVIAVVAFAAVFAPALAPYEPEEFTIEVLQGPSRAHVFGTDELGRDVFSRVLYGARISPVIGVIAIAIAGVIGTALGLISGYAGGLSDNLVMRGMDILLAFPGILLAIVIVATLGPGLRNAMIAVAVGFIPTFARVVRGDVLVEREKEYVAAARVLGASGSRIVFREILPSVWSPVVVLATLGVAGAILAAAGLSFLGLGAAPPTAEWGAMLSEGRNYLPDQWWIAVFPGSAIAVTVLGINLVGDGLRDTLDPRL
jgi:peptide/nickel transport system permease protein